MIVVGVKKAKDSLSRLLSMVKSGEEVLITERGRPIARIIEEGRGRDKIQLELKKMALEGVVELPVQDIRKKPSCLAGSEGKTASDMVIEDRR